jgi:bud site selection protein 20
VCSPCRVQLDDDVPGGGQHYCISCSKYCVSSTALQQHQRTKPHKRRLSEMVRLKQSGQRPHTAADAEHAAGMGAPDNGKPLRTYLGPISMAE